MLRTKTWLDSHGLDLVMHKMELLLILLHVEMSIKNELIRTKSSVIYLEIRLDPRLGICEQSPEYRKIAQPINGENWRPATG